MHGTNTTMVPIVSFCLSCSSWFCVSQQCKHGCNAK